MSRAFRNARVAALVMLFGLLQGCVDARGAWRPDQHILTRLESSIKLPADAKPLTSYARYYAGASERGRRVVRGVLVQRSDKKPGVSVVAPSDLPEIYDGGCGVIDLAYDVASEQIVSLECHGSA